MIISPGALFIFPKFWFFGLLGGSKGKKGPKWQKKLCLSPLISQEPYIIWSSFIVNMWKRIISPGFSSHFFKILIFGINSGEKEQKVAQMTKNFICGTNISGSIHYMSVIFGTQVKWWLLQMLFSFFFKVWFSGLLGGKREKNGSKRQNILFLTPYLKNRTSYDCGFWYTCAKWWYLQQFQN